MIRTEGEGDLMTCTVGHGARYLTCIDIHIDVIHALYPYPNHFPILLFFHNTSFTTVNNSAVEFHAAFRISSSKCSNLSLSPPRTTFPPSQFTKKGTFNLLSSSATILTASSTPFAPSTSLLAAYPPPRYPVIISS